MTKYVQREILNHRRLNHPHIIQLIEVFLTPTHLAIVMEYAPGGDMYQYVLQRRGLAEFDALWFFQQVVIAVDYCHKMVLCVMVVVGCFWYSGWLMTWGCVWGCVCVCIVQRTIHDCIATVDWMGCTDSCTIAIHPITQGIVNRDIKLENTLLDDSPRPLIRLCDFGYSKVWCKGKANLRVL